jgi:2-keto-4-pentenoate hydratase
MDVTAFASEIVDARRNRRLIARPSDRTSPAELGDGYDIGDRVAQRWEQLGYLRCGIKIGLTYRGAWPRLGICCPVWAPVYAQTCRSDGTAQIGGLCAPRIEAEVVVGLVAELGPGATADDIERAVGWATLGFELVDCHYPGWQLTPPDLIADFGCHAGLVLSEQRLRTGASRLRALHIELRCDGQQVAYGHGDDVLGGPFAALRAILAAPHAPTIKAGEVVATGALTRGAHPVVPGQAWQLLPTAGSDFTPCTVLLAA